MVRILLLLVLVSCNQNHNKSVYSTCPSHLEVTTIARGESFHKDGMSTEIIFLDDQNFLVAHLPRKTGGKNRLQIYTWKNDKWILNQKLSSNLPFVYHPRQIIKADVDGDKIEEVIIADHGTDVEPFPGSHPVILKLQKNKWVYDKQSEKLGITYAFNVGVIPYKQSSALFLARVFRPRDPYFYVWEKTKWVDKSSEMPAELNELCYMTAAPGDFDSNGKVDLYIGSCDLPEPDEKHARDLIITSDGERMRLVKSDKIPTRKDKTNWGTVFIKPFNFNDDSKIDLLIATHDYGFHRWKTYLYKNTSSKEGEFAFDEIMFPLVQEENTEGYVNSIENFSTNGAGEAYLFEVRSVIRDKKFQEPQSGTRLVIHDKENALVEATSCLPEEVRRHSFRMKQYPDNPTKVLLIPWEGTIYELSLKKK